MDVIRC